MVAPLIRIATSSPIFVPPQVGNLAAWIDASAISGLANNDPCGTWLDIGRNRNHFTQTGVAHLKPTYKTNQLNSLPAVSFDGGDYLTCASSALAGTDKAMSIIYVAKPASTPAGNVYVFGAYSSSAANPLVPTGYAAGNVMRGGKRDDANTSNISSSVTTITAANANILAHIYSGTTNRMYCNGASILGATACDVGALTVDQLIIGALNASLATPFSGLFFEGFMYSTELTDAERIIIQNYLSSKWGIALS